MGCGKGKRRASGRSVQLSIRGTDWVGRGVGCRCQGTGEVLVVRNVEQAATEGNLGST